MRSAIRFCFILVLLAQTVGLSGQNYVYGTNILTRYSNLRVRNVAHARDTVVIDTLTVLPQEVILYSESAVIDTARYTIKDRLLIWRKPPQLNTIYRLRYRVLPFRLDAPTAHKDTAWFLSPKTITNGKTAVYTYNPQGYANRTPSIFDYKGLNYSGSLARGVSVGNAQDLVLNSQFNLQLNGRIGDDIDIVGSISDQNIPLQPDGNTQRLQEFDKIYLRIARRRTALTVGDYDLTRPRSYFTNYTRRLQGFMVETSRGSVEKTGSVVSGSGAAAVSRGRFVRNTLVALEGNQGPYKLTGGNGERFLIIIANTEKVFIDGVAMRRGVENDYTINYNTGEIVFTPKQLITKDKRIVVEFTYSEQTYLRYITAANANYETKRLRAHAHWFAETDSKNQSQQTALTDEQRATLSNIGDSLQNAFVSGARLSENGYNPKVIQYAKLDTITNNNRIYSIYNYSTNPSKALYLLSFTEVGAGRGDYIVAVNNAANGRVYQWLAPDSITGKSRGNYAPITKLNTPKRQQLFSAGADYTFSEHWNASAEIGVSNKDNNLFSEADKADDTGVAGAAALNGKYKIGEAHTLTANVRYEGVQRSFEALDPYRAVEFVRDWNTNNLAKTNEHLGFATLQYQNNQYGSVAYEVAALRKDSVYDGLRHSARLALQHNGFQLISNSSYLQTNTKAERTAYLRPNIEVSKTWRGIGEKPQPIKIGIYAEQENNQRKSQQNDTLLLGSFAFDMYKIYAKWGADSSRVTTGGFYQHRNDYGRSRTALPLATTANDLNINGNWTVSAAQNLRWNLTYRQLTIADSTLTATKKPQDTYLGRVDYSLRVLRNAAAFQTVYELGSGQEQRIGYNYLEVLAGQGQYAWIDRNGDGVKQLNEFEISAFADQARYVRVNTFSGTYIRSNVVNLTQSLALTPRSFWRKPPPETFGFQSFVSRFSTQSAVQINRKTREAATVQAWNPYQLNLPDTLLVSTNTNIRNTLFFNRSEQIFGAEYTWSNLKNQVALVSGYEQRGRNEQQLRLRYNPSAVWSITTESDFGTKLNSNQLFTDRDYALQFQRQNIKIAWLHQQKLRISAAYTFTDSYNRISTAALRESAQSHDLTAELTYNQATKSSLSAKLSWINMAFVGNADTPVGFALLEGLQRGKNYLITTTYSRKLTRNLQLELNYEGRQTGDTARFVHIGRMQIRAVF